MEWQRQGVGNGYDIGYFEVYTVFSGEPVWPLEEFM